MTDIQPGSNLALFGGSFDPVHKGHLQAVSEAAEQLGVSRVTLLPCHIPPHKNTLHASAADRLAMLNLAVQGYTRLIVSDWELQQTQSSYTVATLQHYRALLGEQSSLIFFMGWDSLQNLQSWYCWQQLETLASFAVWTRPGYSQVSEPVQLWLNQRLVPAGELSRYPAGRVALLETTPVSISSTQLRQQLAQGENPQNLIAEAVMDYIRRKKLYGYPA